MATSSWACGQVVGVDVDVHRPHRVGAVVAPAQLPEDALGAEPGDQHARLELVERGEQPDHADVGHSQTVVPRAARLVRNAGTVPRVERRIFGLENEYGVTCTLRGQRRLSPDEVARYLFRRVVSWGRSSNVFLQNGARLYLDVGSHPEYATPECDSIYDLVVHDKAGERILEQLLASAEQRLREEGIRGVIYLFKNNTDSAGNSYGCHENYLTSRRDDLAHYAEVLIPFFVSRQIYAGAGKVLQTARGAIYCIAQRAEHIWEGVSSATTRSRPDHQHPRRAPRRRRALPPPPRHRGRLQHERVHHLPQGGGHVDPAAHAGGPVGRAARHDAGEPDPRHPRDQPRHDLPAHGAPGQRPRGVGARHPAGVPRPGPALRRHQGPVAARGEGARDVGALRHRHRARPAVARPGDRLGHQAPPDRGVPRPSTTCRCRTRRSR